MAEASSGGGRGSHAAPGPLMEQAADQYEADLARVLALSLETAELERLQREGSVGGRRDRSASASEEVVTTAVCPRSRPEGKRISPPPGLQPPPGLPPRKMVDRPPVSGGGQVPAPPVRPAGQDLMSFASPAPAPRPPGPSLSQDLHSLNFGNSLLNNNNKAVLPQLKAVQELFRRADPPAGPPPQPLPRSLLPARLPLESLYRQGPAAALPRPTTPALPPAPPPSMVKSSSWAADSRPPELRPTTSTPKPRPVSVAERPGGSRPAGQARLSLDSRLKGDSTSLMGFPAQAEEPGLNTTTVSVLDIFDPLAEGGEEEAEEEDIYWSSRKSMSSFSESFYDTHDPFSYMEQQAELASRLGEVEGEDEDDCPAPVVPRRLVGVVRPTSFAAEDTVLRRQRTARDYENIVKKDKLILEKVGVVRKPRVALDEDVLSFVSMVREVRRAFPASDQATNPGFVAAARLEAAYPPDTQVKLVIGKVVFTASVDTEMEQVVAAVLAQGDSRGEPGEHWLQVAGQAEYLTDGRLSDYEYVHLCYKYTRDVRLALVRRDAVPRCLARTEADDVRDFEVGFAEISPLDAVKTLSYSELEILLATLHREAERMSSTGHTLASCSDREVMAALRPRQVLQAVKAVSSLLGGVESIDLKEARERLTMVCLQFDQAKGNADPAGRLRPEIVEEVGERLAMVTLSKAGGDFRAQAAALDSVLQQLKSRVEGLVRTYARTFRVDFQLEAERGEGGGPGEARLTTAVRETLVVRVCCVHRLPAGWTHADYRVDLRVYHGTRLVGETLATAARPGTREPNTLHAAVWLDHWLEAAGLPIASVPLEARLVLSLVGRSLVPGERGEPDSYRAEELGWAAIQLFGQDRALAQGAFLLPVWPVEAVQQVGPAPDSGSHPGGASCPLVSLELPALGGPVTFPGEQEAAMAAPAGPAEGPRPLHQLDTNSRQQLLDICEQDILEFTKRSPAERELVWDRRHYLGGVAGALPKVLLAAQAWGPASLPPLYRLLAAWPRPATPDILQLLLPTFPDSRVRASAVGWLAELPTHQLIDFLPQLVEAVKHETWTASPLSRLLLERSLACPRVAHSLYWLLTQALPGISPQNSLDSASPEETMDNPVAVARYHRRLQLLLRAVFAVSGEKVQHRLLAQQVLVKCLNDAAVAVKTSKDSVKGTVLARRMGELDHQLNTKPTLIPLSASLVAKGVDGRNCSYFNSNAFPLKLVLNSAEEEGGVIKAIYKVGDDLRQDMLTLQMIRVIDRLWLREGLDLRMVSFKCVPTGWRAGVVEFVEEAATLGEIHTQGGGVTGSFEGGVLNTWLQKHNQSPLEIAQAVNNFTRSCAGYSVITYIMGIGDRHNDNIMVKKSGHLFHIDFGKFLGDAQKFAGFSRDRVPFVLTPDMVFVINGGDKMTQRFHGFVDLCCQAFNFLRASGNLLLTLFSLMTSSGIPGVNKGAVEYVQNRLLLDLSNAEAAARFSQLIHESMDGKLFTQFNFFVHNLAQLKFGGDSASSEEPGSLSFIPRKYSQEGEGRVVAVQVHGIQKRYDQEKYYVFILRVERAGQTDPTYIFRTYKEFHEFHSKLCLLYPLTKFHSLTKGLSIGRSEIREVAERRKNEIGGFLSGLFRLTDEISHSDLVYTFFHPLHRDQEEASIHIAKLKDPRRASHQRKPSAGRICGKLKLSLSYSSDSLKVMVLHVQNLGFSDQAREEPNAYVKVYLTPDPTKQTKRKTKVVKKNCNPSFMEMLEYRVPLRTVRARTLHASVWDCSQFQENMFLGSVSLPLAEADLEAGIEDWFPLGQFSRA